MTEEETETYEIDELEDMINNTYGSFLFLKSEAYIDIVKIFLIKKDFKSARWITERVKNNYLKGKLYIMIAKASGEKGDLESAKDATAKIKNNYENKIINYRRIADMFKEKGDLGGFKDVMKEVGIINKKEQRYEIIAIVCVVLLLSIAYIAYITHI